MPILDHDGARLHYVVEGEGPPLLLIMGLGYPAAAWWRVLPWLTPHFTTIRFDNRGVGSTGPDASGPYTVERMAADALAVLHACGYESADVWGVSMGGTIAQELALGSPDSVRRLILGCTHAGGADFVIDADALALLANRQAMTPRQAAEAAIPFVYSPSTEVSDIEADIERRLEIPTTAEGYAMQLVGAAAWGGSGARLHEIDCPTLVVHGRIDRLVPLANGEFIAERIDGARLSVIDDASHIFWTDQPDATQLMVEDFLGVRG